MKKRFISILLVLMMSTFFLAGCGKKEVNEITTGDSTTVDDNMADAATDGSPDEGSTEVIANDAEATGETKYSLPSDESGSSVVTFEDYAFFINQTDIIKMNVNNGECTILWKPGDDNLHDMYYGANGTGLILYNKLYFMHSDSRVVNSDYVTIYTLCSIDIETGEFDEKQIYEGSDYIVGNLYYKDHMLYVDGDGLKDVFKIDDEGEIVESIARTSDESYKMMPKGYSTLCYNNNGSQTLFPIKTLEYGKRLVLVNSNYDTVIYDVNNGRETLVGGFVLSYYGERILTYEFRDDEYIYGTLDISTGEYKLLGKYKESLNVISMDDKYVYYVKSVDGGDFVHYNRINIETGKEDSVYSLAREDSALNLNTWSFGNVVFDGKNIYTTYSNDYKVKIAALNTESGETTVSDMAVYDSRIGEIGTLTHSYEEVKADDETVVCTADIALVNVDEKFGGAKKINGEMTRLINDTLEDAVKESEDAIEWYNLAKEDDGYFAPYSFTYSVNEMSYIDENYLSFLVDGYDFFGGAHGMPVKIGYTFDINTGDRLTLKDLVTVTEEEVKDTGLKYFKKLMDESGGEDIYWDDAADTIHERLGFFFDDFYLTDKGVCFYFAPYELASYAQGYQMVIIPYEELGISL